MLCRARLVRGRKRGGCRRDAAGDDDEGPGFEALYGWLGYEGGGGVLEVGGLEEGVEGVEGCEEVKRWSCEDWEGGEKAEGKKEGGEGW